MRAGLLRALSLGLAVAAGACSDTLTAPVPEMLFSHADGPLPATHVYDFDDCAPGTALQDYEGLTATVRQIIPGVGAATCVAEEGGSAIRFMLVEVDIELDGPATAVTADIFNFVTVQLYSDASFAPTALLGSFNDPALLPSIPEGELIRAIRIIGFDGTLDDLAITFVDGFVPEPEPLPPVVPASSDECKDGGWQDEAFEHLGFKNQGQCVRFVEAGKDPAA